MHKFREMFGSARFAAIGMIHVQALPGTPNYCGSFDQIIELACQEAITYAKTGISGVLVENMHDIPYAQSHDLTPDTIANMTRICSEVRRILPSHTPCGVQILAGANKEALATALAAGLQFIRCEGFVFAHVADEGIMSACAGPLLRYRKNIGAEHIQIFTDIKKKHSSHALTADVSIEETAKAAEFFLSDGLIVTGTATGVPASLGDLKRVKENTGLPVLLGSGVDANNLNQYFEYADGAIIGTHFKEDSKWQNSLCPERVNAFMKKIKTPL